MDEYRKRADSPPDKLRSSLEFDSEADADTARQSGDLVILGAKGAESGAKEEIEQTESSDKDIEKRIEGMKSNLEELAEPQSWSHRERAAAKQRGADEIAASLKAGYWDPRGRDCYPIPHENLTFGRRNSITGHRPSITAPPVPTTGLSRTNSQSRRVSIHQNSRKDRLPPINIHPNDKVALKRTRNTLAAREARQRKIYRVSEPEERNSELEYEFKMWIGSSIDSERSEQGTRSGFLSQAVLGQVTQPNDGSSPESYQPLQARPADSNANAASGFADDRIEWGYVSCPSCPTVFTGGLRLSHLARHKIQRHGASNAAIPGFPCPFEGCSRTYDRSNALIKHMRSSHPEQEIIPRPRRRPQIDAGSTLDDFKATPEYDSSAQARHDMLIDAQAEQEEKDSRKALRDRIEQLGNRLEQLQEHQSTDYAPYSISAPTVAYQDVNTAVVGDKGEEVIKKYDISDPSAWQWESRSNETAGTRGESLRQAPESCLLLPQHDRSMRTESSATTDEDVRNAANVTTTTRGHVTGFETMLDIPSVVSEPYEWTHRDLETFQAYDYDESNVSSYANSVVSVASLASSATDLSLHSTYSALQIAQATKELIKILRDDGELVPLYKRALIDDSIGPEKLQRNLRRLFKRYAEALKEESGDTLQYQASRLVSIKAKEVASSIMKKYDSKHTYHIRTQKNDSDDEYEEQPVDESIFGDLTLFREFLLGSESHVTLRAELQAFALPKAMRIEPVANQPAQEVDNGECAINHVEQLHGMNPGPTNAKVLSRFVQSCTKSFDAALVNIGYREPYLKPGFTRLRWQCKCGDKLYGDVLEYREGGIARMIDRMQRTTGTQVVASNTTDQSYTFRAPRWIRSLGSAFGWSGKRGPCLPKHNQQCDATAAVNPVTSTLPHKSLHLMACMQRGRYRREVDQSRVDAISTDRELFCSMKRRSGARRGIIRRFLSMRCVQGIYFVKFRLRSCNSAEVRDHEPCCTSAVPQMCECIPPATKVEPSTNAEYQCEPAGPLDTYPPVMSRELMHMLSHPELIDENETFVLKQLPKRTKGELKSQVGRPVEGWGIHYEEGWDFDLLIGLVFTTFFAGSLVFAILWSHYEYDLQGAFGVSSYFVTVVGILLACIVNRASKLG